MPRPTRLALGLLATFAAPCALAHASDDRPQALPPSVTAAAGKHLNDPHLRDPFEHTDRPGLHHIAWNDAHDKDHGGHPCSPE